MRTWTDWRWEGCGLTTAHNTMRTWTDWRWEGCRLTTAHNTMRTWTDWRWEGCGLTTARNTMRTWTDWRWEGCGLTTAHNTMRTWTDWRWEGCGLVVAVCCCQYISVNLPSTSWSPLSAGFSRRLTSSVVMSTASPSLDSLWHQSPRQVSYSAASSCS